MPVQRGFRSHPVAATCRRRIATCRRCKRRQSQNRARETSLCRKAVRGSARKRAPCTEEKLHSPPWSVFLQYTAPVYVLILEPLFYKEKFRGSARKRGPCTEEKLHSPPWSVLSRRRTESAVLHKELM